MSARRFAFIRAINTGGRRLTNTELLEPFLAAGYGDVAAYQAAGNVAFRSDREPDEIEAELGELLRAAYGFDAPAFVRTSEDLRTSTTMMPFDADLVSRTEGRTQITFLAGHPSAEQIAEVLALVPDDDHVRFGGRAWFWLPRAGVSDSSLPVARIERILGPMTMRTLGTVERMLAKFPG